ncbi:MAG: polyprenyl synthetase family protein [Candidatus Thermoplasmatota archaeon]|nr:polyprenyl synthetase family protein [Candidatus Thermoplasmatota archaeon]
MAGPAIGVTFMVFPDEYKDRVKKINEYLMHTLDIIQDKNLKAAMAHYPTAGGKRLRPLLATIASEAVGGKADAALPFGVALEMVHNFTLVHDDVMDEDETRRGIKTVHAAFGVPEAILSGDALFARAFEVVLDSEVDDPKLVRLVEIIARAVRLLAEGQQMDMDFEDAVKVTSDQYMKMIELKTAILYSVAAQSGAIVGGATDKQEAALLEYGRMIGLGFQIWDDVLDLESDQATFGKPVLNDIRNGKKTLIVVQALEDLKGPERMEFLSILGKKNATTKELERARDILDDVGAISHATKVADGLISGAKEKLSVLVDSPHKKTLIALADFMVKRKT